MFCFNSDMMSTAEIPYIQLKIKKKSELLSYFVEIVLTQELRIGSVGIACLSGS